MILETRLIALSQAIGEDIKLLRLADGTLTSLNTTAKNNLVASINEVYTLVADVVDDTSGVSVTDATWSASKIYNAIEAAKVAVANSLVNGAPAALNTLSELAAALNNNPSFATNIATQIAARLRFDAPQVLSSIQKAQANANIGSASLVNTGNLDYNLAALYILAKV